MPAPIFTSSEPSGRNFDVRQPECLPQSPSADTETSTPTYNLRGRFVSGRDFTVATDLLDRATDQPARPSWPRWHSCAAFLTISLPTLFMMCALGRPGA